MSVAATPAPRFESTTANAVHLGRCWERIATGSVDAKLTCIDDAVGPWSTEQQRPDLDLTDDLADGLRCLADGRHRRCRAALGERYEREVVLVVPELTGGVLPAQCAATAAWLY